MDSQEKNFIRREVSSLSIDVVGYSRMLAKDDISTVKALHQCEKIITQNAARFGGRIFTQAGDGFLVELLEPSKAVQCALAIQEDLHGYNSNALQAEQIWVRAGIAYGEVIDDHGNLHGKSVNTAVRLQEACPSGGLLVSKKIYDRAAKDCGVPFKNLGELPFKNLLEDIDVYEADIKGADVTDLNDMDIQVDMSLPVKGFGDRAALAVLAFENTSRREELTHIAEGISENLIISLSHMGQFPVIDKSSSFSFKKKSNSLADIGDRLGARYLLTGELWTTDEKMRLFVRLISTESGHSIWAEKYELGQETLLEKIDQISLSISATVENQLDKSEESRARASRISRIDNIGLVWRGRWHLNRMTAKDAQEAKRLFDAALSQNPNDCETLIQLGYWHWISCWAQRRPRADIVTFKNVALKARDANTQDSRGHMLVGSANILLGKQEEALEHFFEAVRLNPSFAVAYAQFGSCYFLDDQPENAISHLETSLRLNPHDYYVFSTYGELAGCHCLLGNWTKAISYARRSMALKPYYWHARMSEITALSKSSDMQGAIKALEALLIRRPDFMSSNYIDWLPFKNKGWNAFFQNSIDEVYAAMTNQNPPLKRAIN